MRCYSSRLICSKDYALDTSGGHFNWCFRFQHNCNYTVLTNQCESRHGASLFVLSFKFVWQNTSLPIAPSPLPSLSTLLCPNRVDDTRRARATKVEIQAGARVKNGCGRRGGGRNVGVGKRSAGGGQGGRGEAPGGRGKKSR